MQSHGMVHLMTGMIKWPIFIENELKRGGVPQNRAITPKTPLFSKTSGKSKASCLGLFFISPGGAREKLKNGPKTGFLIKKWVILKEKWSIS